MGHVEDGKQWLHPEEALFLVDEVSAITPTVTLLLQIQTDSCAAV